MGMTDEWGFNNLYLFMPRVAYQYPRYFGLLLLGFIQKELTEILLNSRSETFIKNGSQKQG